MLVCGMYNSIFEQCVVSPCAVIFDLHNCLMGRALHSLHSLWTYSLFCMCVPFCSFISKVTYFIKCLIQYITLYLCQFVVVCHNPLMLGNIYIVYSGWGASGTCLSPCSLFSIIIHALQVVTFLYIHCQ